ncbi:DUF397 domain-containing protein [Streptomyces meridianus]|uniref:DUF397 domain-containing protein n=1 Tax=Streptomyces meridianus TaxID=2938945 RepID=A0ABT0X8L3_9ACTN|nr:DUF397 domain-containing protein [Streptomyces meridianus]MCM2578856.1 DUF397 domain-containing protein [Streptomyces meridianus]
MNSSCELAWFKSSYSGTSGGDCVEVAAAESAVHVRDSKNRRGPVLRFSATEWAAFIARTRAESFGEL